MDFIDRLKTLSRSAHVRIPHARTEEAAKTALVMPFLQVLGYDVFDPQEVLPEYVADVGTKRGEKVDYAILKDCKPVIIIECKAVGTPLDTAKITQLFRYFASTPARFGILTDGMNYRFFSDLEEPNRMDETPFLEFDLSEITKEDAENLKRFTKDSFNPEDSIKAAENLKYTAAIKRVLADQLKRPNDGFVRFILDQVHGGPKTKTRVAKFTDLTKHAFREFINDRISDRLQSALESERDEAPEPRTEEEPDATPVPRRSEVVTTEEELAAFAIVKEILGDTVTEDRLHLQDKINYCNIVLDESPLKNVVRLYFNLQNKRIMIRDENGTPVQHPIAGVEDIRTHADALKARAKGLMG